MLKKNLSNVCNILVADDDCIFQSIVQAALIEFDDIRIMSAYDGRSAIELSMMHQFDLLIVDDSFPVVTGAKFVRHFRACSVRNLSIPILRCSAKYHKISFHHDFMWKDVFFPKPFDIQAFSDAVLFLLGRDHTRVLSNAKFSKSISK